MTRTLLLPGQSPLFAETLGKQSRITKLTMGRPLTSKSLMGFSVLPGQQAYRPNHFDFPNS